MAKDQVSKVPFLEAYAQEISALITVLVAFAIARLVDRAFVVRSRRQAARRPGEEEDPGAATRIRVVRPHRERHCLDTSVAPAVKQLANSVLGFGRVGNAIQHAARGASGTQRGTTLETVLLLLLLH